MTVCSTFLQTPVRLAETAADRNFERTIGTAPEDTSVPVIYQGPPRGRATVHVSMAHLVPAVEKLLEYATLPVVSVEVVESVRQFLSDHGASIETPTVNLMSDGGLQLVWRTGDTQVEVEFDPNGDQVVMVDGLDEVRAEEFVAGSQSALLSEALLIISLR